MVLAFPTFDPVAVRLPFPVLTSLQDLTSWSWSYLPIRWYALAYIAAIVLGRLYAGYYLNAPQVYPSRSGLPGRTALDDLPGYLALGIIFGGRLGYCLFYKPSYYMADPAAILRVWEGGMSFHGGLLGAAAAMWYFSLTTGLRVAAVADAVAPAVPIGLLLGRVANFVNGELWGRVSDVSWAMRFPLQGGGWTAPRHPSQLYEAFAEGLLLLLLLNFGLRRGLLRRPWAATGLFLSGYAVARTVCELWREPDAFLGFVLSYDGFGVTQGMLLSLPLLPLGIYLFFKSYREPSRF